MNYENLKKLLTDFQSHPRPTVAIVAATIILAIIGVIVVAWITGFFGEKGKQFASTSSDAQSAVESNVQQQNPGPSVADSVPQPTKDAGASLEPAQTPTTISILEAAQPAAKEIVNQTKSFIPERTAAEVLRNLGDTSLYDFDRKVDDLYLNRWVPEPGWVGIVYSLPSKLDFR